MNKPASRGEMIIPLSSYHNKTRVISTIYVCWITALDFGMYPLIISHPYYCRKLSNKLIIIFIYWLVLTEISKDHIFILSGSEFFRNLIHHPNHNISNSGYTKLLLPKTIHWYVIWYRQIIQWRISQWAE